jgi:ABC-type molybdate transport system substrate-binding protein
MSRTQSLTRRDFLRIATIGAAGSALVGYGVLGLSARGQALRVWSCGGNYDLLLGFNEWFRKQGGGRIVYSSAPVERLVSLLSAQPRGVDLLVGRSGPGWNELQEKERLAALPQVFALDTYVIVVPPGNPAEIHGLADLKRAGLRTVYSPRASGPSGTVVQALLEAADAVVEPGIWEGYVRNAIAAYDCGWKVLDAIAAGTAQAAVTRRSMTTAPEIRGKVEVIPIAVKVMAAMRTGHGAIPQRVAVLVDAPEPGLAESYLHSLLDEPGRRFCEQHGYVHRLSENAEEHRPLFQMRAGRGGSRRGRAERGSGGAESPPPEVGGGRGLGRRHGRGGAGRRGRRAGE